MKSNEPARQKAEIQNFCQWVKHALLYSDLLQAFKEKTFVSAGFSAAETSISTPGGTQTRGTGGKDTGEPSTER